MIDVPRSFFSLDMKLMFIKHHVRTIEWNNSLWSMTVKNRFWERFFFSGGYSWDGCWVWGSQWRGPFITSDKDWTPHSSLNKLSTEFNIRNPQPTQLQSQAVPKPQHIPTSNRSKWSRHTKNTITEDEMKDQLCSLSLSLPLSFGTFDGGEKYRQEMICNFLFRSSPTSPFVVVETTHISLAFLAFNFNRINDFWRRKINWSFLLISVWVMALRLYIIFFLAFAIESWIEAIS